MDAAARCAHPEQHVHTEDDVLQAAADLAGVAAAVRLAHHVLGGGLVVRHVDAVLVMVLVLRSLVVCRVNATAATVRCSRRGLGKCGVRRLTLRADDGCSSHVVVACARKKLAAKFVDAQCPEHSACSLHFYYYLTAATAVVVG